MSRHLISAAACGVLETAAVLRTEYPYVGSKTQISVFFNLIFGQLLPEYSICLPGPWQSCSGSLAILDNWQPYQTPRDGLRFPRSELCSLETSAVRDYCNIGWDVRSISYHLSFFGNLFSHFGPPSIVVLNSGPSTSQNQTLPFMSIAPLSEMAKKCNTIIRVRTDLLCSRKGGLAWSGNRVRHVTWPCVGGLSSWCISRLIGSQQLHFLFMLQRPLYHFQGSLRADASIRALLTSSLARSLHWKQ